MSSPRSSIDSMASSSESGRLRVLLGPTESFDGAVVELDYVTLKGRRVTLLSVLWRRHRIVDRFAVVLHSLRGASMVVCWSESAGSQINTEPSVVEPGLSVGIPSLNNGGVAGALSEQPISGAANDSISRVTQRRCSVLIMASL